MLARMKIPSDTCNTFIKTCTKISIIVLHFQKHSNENICCTVKTFFTKSTRKLYIHYSTILIDFSLVIICKLLKDTYSCPRQVSFINLEIKMLALCSCTWYLNTRESALQLQIHNTLAIFGLR